MVIANKSGWIRMTEAVLGILLLAGVLLVMVDSEVSQQKEDAYVQDLMLGALDDIAENNVLRGDVLTENNASLNASISSSLPSTANFTFEICVLTTGACSGKYPHVVPSSQTVYTEERIIGSNLTAYDPKILRLYVWEA